MQQIDQKPNNWLLAHASNVYSQTGEDGVLLECLELLELRQGWCVEFGAWDGRHLSNTRNLIENHGYSAVLIEGDSKRFAELEALDRPLRRVIPIHAMVGFRSTDSLDTLLRDTPVPQDFDLLSIDIDGNDFHVWQAVSDYRPKIVCIEFNPTIPLDVEFHQPADSRVHQGASLASLVELAGSKGYQLVAVLSLNAIFVRSELFPLFGISDNSPSELWKDRSLVTHLFVGYDGTVFLKGWARLPWHGIDIRPSKLQILPSYIRAYPPAYSPLQRFAYWAFRFFADPAAFCRKVFRRLSGRRDSYGLFGD